jgi:hypothetical protein
MPPDTAENKEAPQPHVPMPIDEQGPELMEATANEDVQSGRAESSTTALSAPTPELPMMSAHQVQ